MLFKEAPRSLAGARGAFRFSLLVRRPPRRSYGPAACADLFRRRADAAPLPDLFL